MDYGVQMIGLITLESWIHAECLSQARIRAWCGSPALPVDTPWIRRLLMVRAGPRSGGTHVTRVVESREGAEVLAAQFGSVFIILQSNGAEKSSRHVHLQQSSGAQLDS
jgi:hypothetical protein